MYAELEQVVHQSGARLLFLPSYSPQLNPIEVCFGRLKAWIQKHANLKFPLYPDDVLQLATKQCITKEPPSTLRLFGHCGYDIGGLQSEPFAALLDNSNID